MEGRKKLKLVLKKEGVKIRTDLNCGSMSNGGILCAQ